MTAAAGQPEWEGLLTILVGKRVKPPILPGWDLLVRDPDPEDDADDGERDETSGASVIIGYADDVGARTQRRINFIRAVGNYGRIDTLYAFCHERKGFRTFRFDRITEMWCPQTGEVLDPIAHAHALAESGAIKANDPALTAIARLMVFMAACDDEFHPAEHAAIERHFGRYFRFFGGTDTAYERVIAEYPRLAPDGSDVARAVRAIGRAPDAKALARFAIEACADVVAADHVLHESEADWAATIQDELKRIGGRK